MKNELIQYTEQDFLGLVKEPYDENCDDQLVEELLVFFNEMIRHPKGSVLITHPMMCGIEDSPEAVIAELKRWYAEQGLPCFKSE
ncbi:bacteriocin immunity protein [Photobacterium galatheae]|uniref:Bacteriocin immunity protein n=1 Tax=Photobacterium galatheae TaxID=1654360 RepID=A0A066RRU7_9GAMM|nr:bacteriocin immunity protein [Photobacterium galatheae]KDM90417.1 hypothetical protein EA58_16965 [Photobacterium galatheae]MCM0147863.1 bacteriocin immunity protein [Photobacterium galatheae]